MNGLWLLVIILIIVAVIGVPNFGFHQWGYYPSGGIGVVVVILIVLLLLGRL